MSNRKFQNVIFKDCGPRLSIDKVVEFETKIGDTLPEDFRRFLCEINGGVSIKRGFQCVNDPPPAPGNNYDPELFAEQRKSDDDLSNLIGQMGDQDQIQKELGGYLGDKASAGLGKMLGSMLKMIGPNPKETEREEQFYRNSFQPRLVLQFFRLNRPLTESIMGFCNKTKIVDAPDIRSLIPFATGTKGTLFLSISKDFFGHVFMGSFNTKATPYYYPGMFSKENQSVTRPLDELTNELVAQSFTEFLDKLFFAKTTYAEGYVPPKSIRRNYVDAFEDNPADADLPLDEEVEPKSERKQKKNSPEDFVASLKLKKVKEQYGPEHDWRGKIRLKHWSDFIESESARVDLQIASEEVDTIPESVYDALRYTFENQKELKRKALQAIVDQIKGWKEDDRDDDDFDYSHVEEIDDLYGSMTLDAINIIIPPDGKPVQVGYAIQCEWSVEHGYAVLMCGDEVLEKGFADILFQYYELEQP